jgi:hypothetical protein
VITPHERQLLERIDRRGRLHSVGLAAIFVWLCVLTVAVFGQSTEVRAAANADRQAFPRGEWPHLFYLNAENIEPEIQALAGPVAAFTLASFSRELVLEHQVPTQITPVLWRLDLRGLGWHWRDWQTVLSRYPYAPDTHYPLIVRADWLAVELWDSFESDSGERLLYGGKTLPKTLADYLKFWQVQAKATDPLVLAHVEQESGVSLLSIRRVENRPTANRGYYWGTEDNAQRNFDGQTDPLENLLNARQHDASEHIFGFLKISSTQGVGGTLQQYALANGKGVKQTRAPVDIVEDATRFRGVAEIRTGGSCVQCHTEGIKPLTKNDLRDLIASGEEIYSDKESQLKIESQYLADLRLRVEIARNQDDYAAGVALVTGMGPAEFSRGFRSFVDAYDAPLSLDDAAREMYVAPEQLKLALGYASQAGVKLGARVSGLAHGRDVPRAHWEESYKSAYLAMQIWRSATK